MVPVSPSRVVTCPLALALCKFRPSRESANAETPLSYALACDVNAPVFVLHARKPPSAHPPINRTSPGPYSNSASARTAPALFSSESEPDDCKRAPRVDRSDDAMVDGARLSDTFFLMSESIVARVARAPRAPECHDAFGEYPTFNGQSRGRRLRRAGKKDYKTRRRRRRRGRRWWRHWCRCRRLEALGRG